MLIPMNLPSGGPRNKELVGVSRIAGLAIGFRSLGRDSVALMVIFLSRIK